MRTAFVHLISVVMVKKKIEASILIEMTGDSMLDAVEGTNPSMVIH